MCNPVLEFKGSVSVLWFGLCLQEIKCKAEEKERKKERVAVLLPETLSHKEAAAQVHHGSASLPFWCELWSPEGNVTVS